MHICCNGSLCSQVAFVVAGATEWVVLLGTLLEKPDVVANVVGSDQLLWDAYVSAIVGTSFEHLLSTIAKERSLRVGN